MLVFRASRLMTGALLAVFDVFDLNILAVAHAEFEEGGVFVDFNGFVVALFVGGKSGSFALALKFCDGEDVECDGIFAEPDFVERRGVVKKAALFALILAKKRVGDVQDDFVAEFGQSINIGQGGGESLGLIEAQGVVQAAEGEAAKMSGGAGEIVIEEGSDADDFCDAFGDEFCDERFAADAGTFFSKFGIAPDQVSNDGTFVKMLFVVTGGAAGSDFDVVMFGEVGKSGETEVNHFFVPDNYFVGGNFCGKQTFNDGGDDARPGAAVGARRGINFYSNDVVGVDERKPSEREIGFCGEMKQPAIEEGADFFRLRLECDGGVRVSGDDNASIARGGFVGKNGIDCICFEQEQARRYK
jgi:hypothetical protein